MSPYSAQATAALNAQFPTQWPTIRDYGFAHPEYVNAINLFAVTDPDIMYSLIPTLGKKRYLVGNGTAWINTGCIPQAGVEAELECQFSSLVADMHYFGTRVSSAVSPTTFNFAVMNGSWVSSSTRGMYPTTPSGSPGPIQNLFYFNVDRIVGLSAKKFSISDGASSYDRTIGTSDVNGITLPIYLFTCNNNGSPHSQISYMLAKRFKIKQGGLVRDMIPCLYGGQRGMADLIGAQFYPDATGNNGFTISETPAS